MKKVASWLNSHKFDVKFMAVIVLILMTIMFGLKSASAQECVETWVRMDTTNPKLMEDLRVFRAIFASLDSISKTEDYVVTSDGIKRFRISGGEFIQVATNPKEFIGTFILDKYAVSEKDIVYRSFGKSADFQVGTKMCWHQTKSAGEYPSKKMVELLVSIRKK